MRNFVNNVLRNTVGYQLSKFDRSGYVYRDFLYSFVREQKPIGKILDTGSATGSFAKKEYQNVTTLDIRPPADVLGSVSSLPFNEKEFDTIICLETLEHVRHPFKAMKEMYRVLKPGGRIICSAPFSYELHDEEYGDYWRFTRQGWEILLEEFVNVTILPYGGNERQPGWYVVSAQRK